jgi:hypothetical protein
MNIIDEKLNAVLSTYKENSAYRTIVNMIVTGNTSNYLRTVVEFNLNQVVPPLWDGLFSGFGIKRIAESNKIKFTPVNLSNLGNYERYIGKPVDVPLQWFSKQYLKAINTQIMFNIKDNNDQWVTSKLRRKDYLVKMYLMCSSSNSREFWSARLETLIRYNNYAINCPIHDTESGSLFVDDLVHSYDIKEEHAIKGFYKTSPNNSVNTVYANDGVWCFEDPKKALARNSRLVTTPDSINLGYKTVFVIESVPKEIGDWFVTGAGYVPNSMLEKLGAMRITSPEGCKFVTMPTPKQTKDDVIYLSKNSFKGSLNGIYMAHYSLPAVGLLDVTQDEVNEFKELNLLEREFQGVKVYGYEIDVNLNASHFFALHGLRSKTVLTEEDQFTIDDELDQSNNSYYLEARANIEANPDYDLLGDIISKINQGTLRYAKDFLDLKIQEFTVAKSSYGDTGIEWMRHVLANANMLGSVEETLDLMTGHSSNTVTINRNSIFQITINNIFKDCKIPQGVFDPEEFANSGVTPDDYKRRLDLLLNGLPESGWDGLLGDSTKNININGFDFYIPSGKTMGDYIHEEEGSERVFFSGPAAAFLKLILSIKNNTTCWETKHINHMIEMQTFLLGKSIDRYTVKGGHYTLVPAPWLKCSEITLLPQTKEYSRGWSVKNNDRVTFSKMPVLFNKAIADMHMINGLPQDLYKVSDRMRLAMRNMMFSNNEVLLDHQNDTDGDMGRISLTGGILPVYDRLPEHMQDWGNSYIADEYDMNIKWKDYTYFPLSYDVNQKVPADAPISMNEAVHESAENKQYVGTGTNGLFYFAHILDMFVSKGVLTFEESQLFRDGYAMAFQDDIIRGIKHESSSSLFREASYRNLFFIDDEGNFNESARLALGALLKDKIGSSMATQRNSLFNEWDKINCNDALMSRRVFDINDIRLYQSQDESDIKLLDSITRSFLKGAEQSQPLFGYKSGGKGSDKAESYSYIMSNVSAYKDKYVLLGQDLSKISGNTTMHHLFSIWSESYDNRVNSDAWVD